MTGELADRIAAEARRAARLYERLVLIVGPSGAGKTAALRAVRRRGGVPLVNVGSSSRGRCST